MSVVSSISIDQNSDQNLKVWLSDQEVFYSRLRACDQDAFKTLYQQYAPAIYGNILRLLNDDAHAKVILEKTFLEVYQTISAYDETKFKIFTWINQIAYRLSQKLVK